MRDENFWRDIILGAAAVVIPIILTGGMALAVMVPGFLIWMIWKGGQR